MIDLTAVHPALVPLVAGEFVDSVAIEPATVGWTADGPTRIDLDGDLVVLGPSPRRVTRPIRAGGLVLEVERIECHPADPVRVVVRLAFDEIRAEDPTVRRNAAAEIPVGAFVRHDGRDRQVEGVTRRWVYLTEPGLRVPPASVQLSPETIRTLRAKVERRAFRYRQMSAWLNELGGLPDGLQGRVFHAFREAVGR